MSGSKERILIVEDEPTMQRVLHDCLARFGYRVIAAADGEEGLTRARQEEPDLILLDVMMPKLDGFALCAELRRVGLQTPILFLSAKASIDDRVRGLDRGGDDYLSKPFSREELLARVRALLRRAKNVTPNIDSLKLGAATIDFVRQKANKAGQELRLSRKEMGMLKLLAERDGGVVSRQEFLDLVWGYAAFPTTRTVDRHIVGLRQKFEPCPDRPQHILTVHGVGYRLVTEALGKSERLQKGNN